MPFSGTCNHCGQPGHKKWQCPILDEIMRKRRAEAGKGGAAVVAASANAATASVGGRPAMDLANEWFSKPITAPPAPAAVEHARPHGFWMLTDAPEVEQKNAFSELSEPVVEQGGEESEGGSEYNEPYDANLDLEVAELTEHFGAARNRCASGAPECAEQTPQAEATLRSRL